MTLYKGYSKIDRESYTMEIETPTAAQKLPRLLSLDALRGFDMFWIIGGDELIKAIAKVNHSQLI